MDVLVCHSGVAEKKYSREAKTILAGSTVQYLAGMKIRDQPGAPIFNIVVVLYIHVRAAYSIESHTSSALEYNGAAE